MAGQSSSSTNKLMHFATQFGRAIRLVFISSPVWSAVGFGAMVLRGLIPLAIVYVTKLIVDAVSANIGTHDLQQAVNAIGPLVLLALMVAVVSAGLESLSSFTQTANAEALRIRMNDDLHAKAVAADLESFESSFYHDKLFRTQQEIGYRPMSVVENLVNAARNAISLMAVIGLVFSFSGIVAFVLLGSCLPRALVRMSYGRKIYRWTIDRTYQERMAYYLRWMMTVSLYAKEVRIYRLADGFRKRYRDIRERLRHEKVGMIRNRSTAEFLGSTFAACAFYGAYAIIVYGAVKGELTLGDLVMYYAAFQLAQEHFKEMMANVADLYEDNLFLTNFFDFMDHPTVVNSPASPQPFPSGNLCLDVENVWFRYPGSEVDVLQGVSMRLEPGRITAIVGENGSGKSTLVKLLCRFYDPGMGRIAIHGTDLRDVNIAELRKHIGVVFQDYSMYPFSAAENIAFGDVDLPSAHQKIQQCAKMACVDKIIDGLDQGYQTVLSKWFEGGRELSAGQWQKIAIARFFYKQSPVMILDEPTNMLDSKSESAFLDNLKDLAADRLVVIISHRVATVEAAGQVYVLERGRIVESGSPGDLMRRMGAYYRLFNHCSQDGTPESDLDIACQE